MLIYICAIGASSLHALDILGVGVRDLNELGTGGDIDFGNALNSDMIICDACK